MARLSLDDLRVDGGERFYPVERLGGLGTALMGFCAAFQGRQDCVWVADAGIRGTGVDSDGAGIGDMIDIYPASWEFHQGDVFEFCARRYAEGALYDLVSLDPPTNLFGDVEKLVDLWCGLANHLVVLGAGPRRLDRVPPGWAQADHMFRSDKYGGVYWAVLEREVEFP